MAVRINPCHGCPLSEGCDLRDELRTRARALGGAALSVSFKCQRILDHLRPGRRIVVTAPVLDEDGGGYGRSIQRIEVKATIMQVDNRARFSCVVDPGQTEEFDASDHDEAKVRFFRFRKRAPHTRIRRILDEPDAVICEAGNVRGADACDTRDGAVCFCRDPYRIAAVECAADQWP